MAVIKNLGETNGDLFMKSQKACMNSARMSYTSWDLLNSGRTERVFRDIFIRITFS